MKDSKRLHPTARQLAKKFHVSLLVVVLGSHAHENASSDEFVYDFTICRQTLKSDTFFFKFHLHLFNFPVNIPRFHVGKIPRFQMVTTLQVHSHQAVRSHAQKFLERRDEEKKIKQKSQK